MLAHAKHTGQAPLTMAGCPLAKSSAAAKWPPPGVTSGRARALQGVTEKTDVTASAGACTCRSTRSMVFAESQPPTHTGFPMFQTGFLLPAWIRPVPRPGCDTRAGKGDVNRRGVPSLAPPVSGHGPGRAPSGQHADRDLRGGAFQRPVTLHLVLKGARRRALRRSRMNSPRRIPSPGPRNARPHRPCSG